MGNLYDCYEELTLSILDKPHALDVLVFWCLPISDDGLFLQAAGWGDEVSLPSRGSVFPPETHDTPVMFKTGDNMGCTYRDDFIQPLLEFAWAHGYIAEVARIQAALQTAGLHRYCIGDARP